MMVFLTKLAGVLAILGFFFGVCLILGGVLVAKGSDHFPLLATSAVINGGTFMTLIAAALGTLVEVSAWRFERHSGAIDAGRASHPVSSTI